MKTLINKTRTTHVYRRLAMTSLLTLSLVVFAVHVPMLIGFTVARYYEPADAAAYAPAEPADAAAA